MGVPLHHITNKAVRLPLNGTGRTFLPAMATAIVAAEKLRRPEMTLPINDVRLGAGQTAIAITVPDGNPLVGRRLRAKHFTERSDGALIVIFDVDDNGVKVVSSANTPGQFNYSETFAHTAKHLASMPRFGKTPCRAELADNRLTVVVPADRVPMVTGPSRDDFRDAVRVVNAFKARMGASLELRIAADDGTLRAAIMEEFQ